MDHAARLPGSSWALWRDVVLRGAGFPARRGSALADPACAVAADRLLELESVGVRARDAAQRALVGALDALRAEGAWHDAARRKPMLEALRSLKRGKDPGQVAEPAARRTLEDHRAATERTADARKAFQRAYAEALLKTSGEIGRVARSSPFREALAWQNRKVLDTALRDLLARPGDKRNSRRRQHEELVASYLQRYATKNDTIGFFGPVGWARIVDHGPAVAVRPGPSLVAERKVYFENWCIDALARALDRESGLRPWLLPRVRSTYHLQGTQLCRPLAPSVELTPAQARLLAACDGSSTASRIADLVIADPQVPLTAPEQVFQALEGFERMGVITWALEVPLELHPERTLARQLRRVEPAALRRRLTARLDELEAERRRVAASAGRAEELAASLDRLEESFTRLTGQTGERLHGRMYAGRGLVYEDCRRDCEVDLGPELLARLGPPLDLVLRSARWVASELAESVTRRLREVYRALRPSAPAGEVDSYAFFLSGVSQIFDVKERDRCFVEVEAEFQQRWGRVLGLHRVEPGTRVLELDVAAVAREAERAFEPRPREPWTLARYVSPDVMIAAPGEEALSRGEAEMVLGEVHSSNSLAWSLMVAQHPEPEELVRAIDRDLAGVDVLLPQRSKRDSTQRMAIGLVSPRFYRYEFVDEPPASPACQSLAAAALVVEDDGERLTARTRDGRVRFDALDLFGDLITPECSDILGRMLPPRPHRPRIRIGDLVIGREAWTFSAGELTELVSSRHDHERFISVRRWARRHGMPRHVFYKLSSETKPCYLDFDSPIYTDMFARLVRKAANPFDEVAVTEMSPRLDQLWLRDAAGELYTAELRMAAFKAGNAGGGTE